MPAALAALVLMVQVAAAPAPVPAIASTGPGAVATPAAGGVDDDKLICRREDETGSRVHVSKVCLTKLQWRQRAADSQSSVEGLQRNGNHAFGAGPGE